MCMHAFVYECAGVNMGMCVQQYIWTSKDNLRCLSFPSTKLT